MNAEIAMQEWWKQARMLVLHTPQIPSVLNFVSGDYSDQVMLIFSFYYLSLQYCKMDLSSSLDRMMYNETFFKNKMILWGK